MDSKLVRLGAFIVTLFVCTILAVVLITNKDVTGKDTKQTTTKTEITQGEDVSIYDIDHSAWMYDETFFDEELIGDGRYEITTEIPAYLTAYSIDNSVRVLLLDENDKLVTGRKYTVTLGGSEKYSDDDRDGVIDVKELKPGTYPLSMQALKGYKVPKDDIKVTVKANIEYKAVNDISYLILTEEDIDPSKEDTAVSDADEESSGNTAIKTTKDSVFGIDVSKYNGDIDWEKVKSEGVKFAIIRCGYRGSSTGAIVEDPYFRANMEGAVNAGIPVGVYFFTQATTEVEAVEEASAVLYLCKDYELTYPVFIDTESAGGNGRADKLEVLERSRCIQAFCETIRSGKYKAGVYASKNWFNNRLDISKLSADNVTWLAEYADEPSYGATYQMWQYSSAGRIPGIEGRVDMNISYLDVDVDSDKDDSLDKDNKTDDKKEVKEDIDNTDKKEEKDEDGQVNSRDMRY